MADQAIPLGPSKGLESSHYRIIEEIGSGGKGVVFCAHGHFDCEAAFMAGRPSMPSSANRTAQFLRRLCTRTCTKLALVMRMRLVSR